MGRMNNSHHHRGEEAGLDGPQNEGRSNKGKVVSVNDGRRGVDSPRFVSVSFTGFERLATRWRKKKGKTQLRGKGGRQEISTQAQP